MAGIRTVARNATLQGAADIVGKVLSLLLYAVLARQLGERSFGEFTFAFSLTFLLMTLASGGIDAVVVREVARDRDALARILWNALAMRAALGTTAVVATVVISYTGHFDPRVQVAAALLGISLLLEVIAKVIGSVFLALDDMRPVARVLVFQRTQTALVGIVALLLGAGIVVVSAIFAASAAIALFSIVRALHRQVGFPALTVSRADAREVLILSLPLGLSAIFTTVLFRVDTLLLAAFKDVVVVGLYGAAYRLLDSTLFISWALNSALSPTLARSSRTSDPPVGDAFTAGLKALFVLLVPIATVLALFGGEIVKIVFGADFAGAASSARWLSATVLLYGVSYLGATVLYTQGSTRLVPWITGAAALENIVLNLILIPRYSLVGAAVATTVTEITRAAALTVVGARLTGALPAARIVAGPLLAAAAMLLVWALLGEGLPALILAPPAYAAVLLAIEHRFHPGDVAMLRAALRRRQAPLVENLEGVS